MARLTEYPAVSCFCAAFGLVHCIEELVQCFLEQDYPGLKQLVLLNDYPDQELIFNHPEVVVVNLPEQITPLGKKFNKCVELCSHDIVAVMEQDDLYLPNHLSYAVENMRNGMFHAGVAWVDTGVSVPWHFSGNWFHASHVFHRDLFEKVGGYPEIDNCTVDVSIMSKFKKEIGHYSQHPSYKDMSYVYGWRPGLHASGYGTQVQNVSELGMNALKYEKSLGRIPSGKVMLNPHFKEDYQMKRVTAILDAEAKYA